MLRGAIGYGSIIERKYSILGSAITDSSREYEVASWAGIHYTAHASSVIEGWLTWANENGVKDTRRLPLAGHDLNETHFCLVSVPFKPSSNLENVTPIETAGMRFAVPWPKDYRTIFDTRSVFADAVRPRHMHINRIIEAELKQNDSPRVQMILRNTMDFADYYLRRFPGADSPLVPVGSVPPM